MRYRTAGLFLIRALGLLLAPLAAEAQQAGKVYRWGSWESPSPPRPLTSWTYFDKGYASEAGLRDRTSS